MIPIYSSAQTKAWDKFTMENEPISSEVLMERAATNFTRLLIGRHFFNHAAIFCGVGNNGGDGLVVARILHEQGIEVLIYIVDFSPNKSADFLLNLKKLSSTISINYLNKEHSNFEVEADIIVDAIFGSGINKQIDNWISAIIKKINQSKNKIIAIDLPSGLSSDISSTFHRNEIIQATETYTFQFSKLSFFFEENAQFIGNFFVVDIGLNANFRAETNFHLFVKKDVSLPQRKLFHHKGNSGKALLVAGFQNQGASLLASKAAFKCGAGYVLVNTKKEFINTFIASTPECMAVENLDDLPRDNISAIGFGPGMGVHEDSKHKLVWCITQKKPFVIDADGINILATNNELLTTLAPNTILTPHVKELERLIGKCNSAFERLEKQIAFSVKHQVIILQKGAFSKISFPNGHVIINSSGNPNLATAGSGDVLTGMITSLLAQGLEPEAAVLNATYIHGQTADSYSRRIGNRGMTASDIILELPKVLNEY